MAVPPRCAMARPALFAPRVRVAGCRASPVYPNGRFDAQSGSFSIETTSGRRAPWSAVVVDGLLVRTFVHGLARWSVRLAVDEAMSGAPTTALISVAGNQIHGIALRGPAAEVDDGRHTVTFELEARDSRVARIVAQHWLGEASRKSGLPIEQARVIWVAPGCRSRAVGHRFIEMARTLVEDEETVDLAAVAAQIHLELHVKALITSAVVDDVSPLRRVLIEDDGDTWRPHHSMARALLKPSFPLSPQRSTRVGRNIKTTSSAATPLPT